MSDDENRRAVELECKVKSLRSELAAWMADSVAGQRLEKHNSQIRAVARTLERPLAAAEKELGRRKGRLAAGRAAELELAVLDLHRLWDFFRSKLAQRHVAHFAPTLRAADELAWKCFEPVRDHIPEGEGREAPLVYLNGASSPLTLARGRPFEAEFVVHEDVRSERALQALKDLPVAVVGIPWFAVEHFPDAPIIAHEIGHDVEADLGLGDRVAALIDAALIKRKAPRVHRAAWKAWASEVFADVYGALALGPAFARALADFLATGPVPLAKQTRQVGVWTRYPTDALRLRLVAAVLDSTEYEDEAAALLGRPGMDRHLMREYRDEPAAVAAALLDGTYPELGDDAGLRGVIAFPTTCHTAAKADAERVLKRRALRGADARVLTAAARLAFDANPRRYVDVGGDKRVIDRIVKMQGVGTRSVKPRDKDDAEAAAVRRDADIGEALTATLFPASGG